MPNKNRTRLDRITQKIRPEMVIVVNWNNERFTSGGRTLTREEYDAMRSDPDVAIVSFLNVEYDDGPPKK